MPPLQFLKGKTKTGESTYVDVQLRYDLLMNSDHTLETQYVTIAHELGHLYCGHLGSPDKNWWPDRFGLSHDIAESVAYLVCKRLGLDCPADKYLAGYLGENENVPEISLDAVAKAAGLIEQMGRKRFILTLSIWS